MILKLNNKKRILVISVIIVIMALAISSTFGLLSATTDPLTNKFEVGTIDTEIKEDDVTFDTNINKNPSIKNVGKGDCLVRVRIDISPKKIADYIEQKKSLIYKYEDNENQERTAYLQDYITNGNVMPNNWKYQDGYWYYQGVLPKEGYTLPIFTQITGLTEKVEDENEPYYKIIDEFIDDISDFQISIYHESIQAVVYDENGNEYDALDEYGNYSQTEADKLWSKYMAQQS